MKKFKLSIIAIVLCMSALLTGCSLCNHENVLAATCIDAAACADCGKTFGKPIGHATNSGYCYRCNSYVNCLKLDTQMVDAIEKKCNESELASSVDIKSINEKTGLEFLPDTAKLSSGFLQDDYFYHIEFSIEAANVATPYVISRNYYAVQDEEAGPGWSIDYHDEIGTQAED